MDAVLCVNLQPHSFLPILPRNILIHSRRAEVLLWTAINIEVLLHRYSIIQEGEMRRLVMLMIGPRQGH